MLLLILLLPLVTVLKQSLGWDEDESPIIGEITEDTIREIVDGHNEYRRNVKPTASNMVKMTWSREAAEAARIWAGKCTGRRSPRDQRFLNGIPCAEGTMQLTYPVSWAEVITKWYSKASNFRYGYGAINPRKEFYSYTQLIWYNTHEVGCAHVYCPQKKYNFYFICRYCPMGNVQGQILTPYKTGPSCGDCPDNCEDKLCTNPCKYMDRAYNCHLLKEMFGNCYESPLKDECQATCNCPTEII